MRTIVAMSELTRKCIADGWNPATGAVPEGDRNLRNYFSFSSNIPEDAVLQYDLVNNIPDYPDTFNPQQRLEVNQRCEQLHILKEQFGNEAYTVNAISSFEIIDPS